MRTDDGGEFLALKDFFLENGIIHQTTILYTSQQNGRVEPKYHLIPNVAHVLLFQSNLPVSFWEECILTIGYLINHTPSPLLKEQTFFELLHNTPPDYSLLCTVGCLCYIHQPTTDKFHSRSRKCIFIGYPLDK